MYTEQMNLWDNTPGLCEEVPTITYYKPDVKKSDAAVVIFPGGGYNHRAPHEGEGYAKFLAENGISAFVVAYRVAPHHFPLPLLDARRGVRFVRYYAEKYGIDKNKVAVHPQADILRHLPLHIQILLISKVQTISTRKNFCPMHKFFATLL